MKIEKYDDNRPYPKDKMYDILHRVKNKYNISEGDFDIIRDNLNEMERKLRYECEEIEFEVSRVTFEPAFSIFKLDISLSTNILSYICLNEVEVRMDETGLIHANLPTTFDWWHGKIHPIVFGKWYAIEKFIVNFVNNNPHMLSMLKNIEKGIDWRSIGKLESTRKS